MHQDHEDFQKKRRLAIIHLVVSLIIQVLVLGFYYFKEKQTVLSFPMLLGIFMTISSIVTVNQLGKR